MSDFNGSYLAQVTPATDWFFVEDPSDPSDLNCDPAVYRVAAWATLKDGDVVGLIAVDARNYRKPRDRARLHIVPETAGVYLHQSQLSDRELALAKRR